MHLVVRVYLVCGENVDMHVCVYVCVCVCVCVMRER